MQNALEEAGANINALAGLIPTAVSDLTNDVPFVSAATLTDSLLVVRDSMAAIRGGGGTVNTITSTDGNLSFDATDPANIVATNNAPDQTVSITGAGSVAVTGTYPNFTATGSGVTGSGTVNAIPVFTGTSTITGTSAFTWDGNRLVMTPASLSNTFIRGGNGTLTGNHNIGIGASVLTNITSGLYNIGIGLTALNGVLTGIGNIAIGFQSQQNGTSASHNVSIGNFALSSITTGAENVGICLNALQNNTTGNLNVAIGRNAISSAATSTGNFGLGYFSLSSMTTGDNNMGIGTSAGRYTGTGNNTSSSNSIFIGAETKPLVSGQTNQVVIGHGAVGNGSNTVTIGNTSTIGTYLSSLRITTNTTAGRGIGVEGYLGANSTTKALDYHDGTSFGRLYPHTDVTPTNGQIPYFNSTTGMYVPTTPTYLTSEVDGSTTNEIQTLSNAAGAGLALSLGGGTVGLISSDAGNTLSAGTDNKLYSAAGAGASVTYTGTLSGGISTTISLYGFAPVYSTSGGVVTAANTTLNTTLHQYYVQGATGSIVILGAGTKQVTATFTYTAGITYYLNDAGGLATSADADGDAIDYDSAVVYCVAALGGNEYLINLKDPRHFVNN